MPQDILPVSLPSAATVTIVTAQTNATGANFTTFGSQACSKLDLVNTTGVDIEYQRGGSGSTFKVPNNSGRLIIGIVNANQIGIRRVDQSNTQVTVNAEAIL